MLLLLAIGACSTPEAPTPCVPDVPAAFEAVSGTATALAIADGHVFAGEPLRYAFDQDNDWGIDNHLQGITRSGDRLFISGGDVRRQRADVFVAEQLDGSWQMTGELALDQGSEWHAGGIDSHDGVLAVPTENLRGALGPRSASIRLFDVGRDGGDALIEVVPLADGVTTAHAAGLAVVEGTPWLASWDDQRIDWYRGRGTGPRDGFESEPAATTNAADVAIEVPEAGTEGMHGQSLALVAECGGGLYALMGDNTSDLPIDGGTNFIDLYRVHPEAGMAMSKVGSRAVDCPADQGCNLRAAGGAWVAEDAEIGVYSTPYWRDAEAGLTRLGEF